MTAVMEVDIQSTTKKNAPEAPGLSDRELDEGARILGSLQTVRRSLERDDTSDSVAVRLIAKNVVSLEQTIVAFSSYIRRVARYEYPNQRRVVEEILYERREYFDELSRREFGKPVLWDRPQANDPGSST